MWAHYAEEIFYTPAFVRSNQLRVASGKGVLILSDDPYFGIGGLFRQLWYFANEGQNHFLSLQPRFVYREEKTVTFYRGLWSLGSMLPGFSGHSYSINTLDSVFLSPSMFWFSKGLVTYLCCRRHAREVFLGGTAVHLLLMARFPPGMVIAFGCFTVSNLCLLRSTLTDVASYWQSLHAWLRSKTCFITHFVHEWNYAHPGTMKMYWRYFKRHVSWFLNR